MVSFNTRAGAVTLLTADITGAGGAPIASPTFTGVPAGPTAGLGTNTTQLATTAFVLAQLAASGVSSFNTRTGAVVLLLADVTGVGGAPLSSPTFSGDPKAPTPAPGDNDTSIATTAFVTAALAAAPQVRYWGGTITATAVGSNVTVNAGTTTGVVTFASAHGIASGSVAAVALGATGSGTLTANSSFYFRALSATTGAFYLLLSDAQADINRIISQRHHDGVDDQGHHLQQCRYLGLRPDSSDWLLERPHPGRPGA